MNRPSDAMPDPCDFLTPGPVPPAPGTHERVLDRTLDVIRRRRRLSRAAWLGSLAACFAGGMLTALGLRATPEPVVVTIQRDVVSPPAEAPERKIVPTETAR